MMCPPGLPTGIEQLKIKKWENKHENFTQKLKKNASFKLRNPQNFSDKSDKYRATTANMMWLIQHADSEDFQLRAMGSGWSFTKVGVGRDGIVDTKALYLSFRPGDSFVKDEYRQRGGTADDLYFLQCGNSIVQVNSKLQARGRSIKASGASNGQTIAGAMSTGTHGSAFKVGAIQDSVVGLHIVVGPDRHVYLERESYTVVTDDFVSWLDDAEHIKNDILFNAALVSFGSFGMIHGMMIETEPLFLLEEYRDRMVYNVQLINGINQLDLSGIPNPPNYTGHPDDIYHFEVLLNPHDFRANDPDKGVFLKRMYKMPFRNNYDVRDNTGGGFTYGDDLLGVVQKALDMMGPLSPLVIPGLVRTLFGLAFSTNIPQPQVGTIGETFTYTKFRGRAASAALGIDVSNSQQVLGELVEINRRKPFPGGFALRFVKGTQALLGFTKFPVTCVLEMDGVDSSATNKFYEACWDRLEDLGIPYTLHWGKMNFNLDDQRIRSMYGANRDRWVKARMSLLDARTRLIFNNDFLHRCGLDMDIPDFDPDTDVIV